MKLNGKRGAGDVEVIWADQVEAILGGELDPNRASPMEPPNIAGWGQLLGNTMRWSAPASRQANETLSAKVRGWMDSVIGLKWLIVLDPKPAPRGQQPIDMYLVDLKSGAVACHGNVTATSDPNVANAVSYDVEAGTNRRTGGMKIDRYGDALRASMIEEVSKALRQQLHVDLGSMCATPCDD